MQMMSENSTLVFPAQEWDSKGRSVKAEERSVVSVGLAFEMKWFRGITSGPSPGPPRLPPSSTARKKQALCRVSPSPCAMIVLSYFRLITKGSLCPAAPRGEAKLR